MQSRTSRLRELWAYFGPAFVASVAYIDPGNFGANIVGGAQHGYTLLWVLLWSNLMAIQVQYLSAKLGIATGQSLPANCRRHFARRTVFMLWALPKSAPSPPTWPSSWAPRSGLTCSAGRCC